MNQNNLEYLKKQLLNMGFNDKLNAEMEKNINDQLTKFTIPVLIGFVRGDKNDQVEFNVDFSKSNESDRYFINKFDATLRGEDPSKDRTHTFYIDKSGSFTAKQAFNMLEGRAVHREVNDKDGNPYQQWIQLDLSQKNEKGKFVANTYHTNYGFDLEKALAQHPVKELSDPVHKERLISSLERGNVQSVTFKNGDQETKMFIEVNPKMKNLTVYNEQMEKQFLGIKKEKIQSEAGEQSEQSSKKKEQETNQEVPSQDKKKRRGLSV